MGGIVEYENHRISIDKNTQVGSIILRTIGTQTYALKVKEDPSGYIRDGDDIITSVELSNEISKKGTSPVKIHTLLNEEIATEGKLDKILRVSGGGIPLHKGYGDLVVTFIPKYQILKEKEYYQIQHNAVTVRIRFQHYVARERKLLDGSSIPKVYRIPPNEAALAKRRPYYVRYPHDGDIKKGARLDLVFEIVSS